MRGCCIYRLMLKEQQRYFLIVNMCFWALFIKFLNCKYFMGKFFITYHFLFLVLQLFNTQFEFIMGFWIFAKVLLLPWIYEWKLLFSYRKSDFTMLELSDMVYVVRMIYLELFFNCLVLVAGVEHCWFNPSYSQCLSFWRKEKTCSETGKVHWLHGEIFSFYILYWYIVN